MTHETCEPYAGGTRCRPEGDTLHLVDMPTWRDVTGTLPLQGYVWPLAFSISGARVALVSSGATTSTLVIVDAANGQTLAQRTLEFPPSQLQFAANGSMLALYGQPEGAPPGEGRPGTPRALLLDAGTLATLWEARLPDIIAGFWCQANCNGPHGEQIYASWTPAVVPAAGGNALYIVHADGDRLTTVDFDARTVRTTAIDGAQSRAAGQEHPVVRAGRSLLEWLLSLGAGVAEAKGPMVGATKAGVLSPDGKRLYVVGQTLDDRAEAGAEREPVQTPLGLLVVDTATGRRLAWRETQATQIGISHDGATLFMVGWGQDAPWTEAVDAQSLARLALLNGWEARTVPALDGREIVVAARPHVGQSRLALLEPGTFKIAAEWQPVVDDMWVW